MSPTGNFLLPELLGALSSFFDEMGLKGKSPSVPALVAFSVDLRTSRTHLV